MTRPIIEVDGVGKRYRLGQLNAGTLGEEARRFMRRLRGGGGAERAEATDFWALDDVSFSVQPGEVVGVIGRNGAGKSTLLKILSRVTEPTRGQVRIRGRVASLLEVGTGFHPELTGRENVFLNGAILGMTHAEIAAKFDEIVAFSGVEQFLDTPVKRYSSGMYVRLAFAVAAHLEPEILIVDEVLAVGDAEFQRKCLGKMSDISGKQGRTVLFVSHNMASVLALCSKGVIVDRGRITHEGTAAEAVGEYQRSLSAESLIPIGHRPDRMGDGSARITSIQISALDDDRVIRSRSRLKITIGYESDRPIQRPTFQLGVYDELNSGIFLLSSEGTSFGVLPPRGSVVCVTEPIRLTAGRCYVNAVLLQSGVRSDHVLNAATFDVETENSLDTGKEPSRDWMLCIIQHEWTANEAAARQEEVECP